MMHTGILCLLGVLPLLKHKPRSHKGQMQNHINLIKSQPVMHQSLKPGKQRRHKPFIKLHQLIALPPAILFNQMNRAVKMRDRNKRLDPVFPALPEYILIKPKPFLIRLRLIPFGENSAPRN